MLLHQWLWLGFCTLILGLISTSFAQDSPPIGQPPPRISDPRQLNKQFEIKRPNVDRGMLKRLREELMYPFEEKDFLRVITRSKAYHDVPLPFRLPFFGFDYTYIWIQKDGYITFNRGLLDYKFPIKFPTPFLDDKREIDPSLLAPWFSSQDIPPEVKDSGVYYRYIQMDLEQNSTLRERIILDFREGMIGAYTHFGESKIFDPKHVLIITWKNMTMTNRRPESPLKTNTYQAVLATDEIRTYAMFNYEWIEWITHMDIFDGLNGAPAFVGFNAGNRTRAFEFRPYSQNPRIKLLPTRGWGNNLPGRFFFQIDEEVWPGSCVERELDPNWPQRPKLTFFPRWGSMLGGTLVNITGPCIPNSDSIIKCKFDVFDVEGVWRSINHVSCISPPVVYHGYIDLQISINNEGYFFIGRFYVQPPDITEEDLIVLKDQDREEKPNALEFKWKANELSWDREATVKFHLWGYREDHERYPELTYIANLTSEEVVQNTGYYIMDMEKFRNRYNPETFDLTFGYISLNFTEPIGEHFQASPVIWSRSMPLSWYFWPQWERQLGVKRWHEKMCDKWYYQEKYADRFAITLFRCPCTHAQAELDRGRFTPDPDCNVITKRGCQTFHKTAQHCIRSGRPAVGGAGQQCCYDTYGELLRTADSAFSGHPARSFSYGKHPFRWRMMVPSLSYWLHDVMPFFFCCKWSPDEENSDSCQKFKYWRTSQDCSSYQSPGVAAVFGDPHFVTYDRVNYTFNARGEFVLTRVDDPVHKLDVQARFEHIDSKSPNGPEVNATKLTSIAVRDNQSAIIEFRLRPVAASWRFHMYVIADKEYVFFWDESLRVQNFKGVTIYQPAGIWNMSHIVAMFDSGAGIEVTADKGHMAAQVYLPLTFMNKTYGLLGHWSRDPVDDFMTPDKNPTEFTTRSRDIYENFGDKWRLKESEVDNVGESLFFHDSIPFSQFDDKNFKPRFMDLLEIPKNFSVPREEIIQICGESMACQYDFVATRDKVYASLTSQHESRAQKLSRDVRIKTVRCPELPKPLNGRKSDIGYSVGTIVRFSCDDGYRLNGYENRRCRDTGLWTWGVDPECISNQAYGRKVAGGALGIAIPILILVAIIISCFVIRSRQRARHVTGENGMPDRKLVEIQNMPPPHRSQSIPIDPEKKRLEDEV